MTKRLSPRSSSIVLLLLLLVVATTIRPSTCNTTGPISSREEDLSLSTIQRTSTKAYQPVILSSRRYLPTSMGILPMHYKGGFLPHFHSSSSSSNNNNIGTTINTRNHIPSQHERLFAIRGGTDAITSSDHTQDLLQAVDLFGTAVFAFSGALTAGKKGMDVMGMCIIATITSVGGGTVRDVLLDSGTVFWMQQTLYLQICCTTALLTYLCWPTLEAKLGWKDSAKPICTADALGLAAFSVLGTQKAIGMNLHPLIWIVSGVMTSCFGGLVRDLLCREPRPRILYPDRSVYGTPPLLGAIAYTLMTLHGRRSHNVVVVVVDETPSAVIVLVSFLVTFTTRVWCFNTKTRLPHWNDNDGDHQSESSGLIKVDDFQRRKC
jgi:uncharacterized membrane protein YeiH